VRPYLKTSSPQKGKRHSNQQEKTQTSIFADSREGRKKIFADVFRKKKG
jgi:hypothetical protein